MKFLVCLLSLCTAFPALAVNNGVGEALCQALQDKAPKPHRSLGDLREALTKVGVLKEGVDLGTAAKDADKSLAKLGFKNGHLPSAREIPRGSILVIRGGKDCGTNAQHGHLVVKCGEDEVFSVGAGNQSLSRYLDTNAKCVSAVMAPPEMNEKKVEKFCGDLEKTGKETRGRSLRVVLNSLKRSGLGKTESVKSAKDSEPTFAKLGFRNIGGSAELPVGSIYVLNQKETCTNVNGKYGHVAVRCGEDQVYIGGKMQSLSDFQREYGTCVKAAMYKPEWGQPLAGATDPASRADQGSSIQEAQRPPSTDSENSEGVE